MTIPSWAPFLSLTYRGKKCTTCGHTLLKRNYLPYLPARTSTTWTHFEEEEMNTFEVWNKVHCRRRLQPKSHKAALSLFAPVALLINHGFSAVTVLITIVNGIQHFIFSMLEFQLPDVPNWLFDHQYLVGLVTPWTKSEEEKLVVFVCIFLCFSHITVKIYSFHFSCFFCTCRVSLVMDWRPVLSHFHT